MKVAGALKADPPLPILRFDRIPRPAASPLTSCSRKNHKMFSVNVIHRKDRSVSCGGVRNRTAWQFSVLLISEGLWDGLRPMRRIYYQQLVYKRIPAAPRVALARAKLRDSRTSASEALPAFLWSLRRQNDTLRTDRVANLEGQV
jgi:hypothetical protein